MALLESCLTYKYLAVDTEGFTADTCLGISIATPLINYAGKQSMYFPVGHTEDVNIDSEVYEFLVHVLKVVPHPIMHNAAHDITILPFLSDSRFICTMIMAHMVDENVMSKGLDYLHKYYCGGEGKQMDPLMESIIKTMGWYHVPFYLMNMYGDNDAVITMQLFLKLLPLYEEQFGPMWS